MRKCQIPIPRGARPPSLPTLMPVQYHQTVLPRLSALVGAIFLFSERKSKKTEKFNSYILIFKIKETLTNKTTHVCFKNWYNFNNLPRNFARNYQFQQQIY